MNKSWTIQETYTLPSHGKIYRNPVAETFTISSLTTNQEMQRLSKSDRLYEPLCNIIDDCMVNDIGISAYDMCLGDYIYCLYMLRIVTYGSSYNITPTCSYCGHVGKEKFDLHDLLVKEYTEDINKYLNFTLPVCGYEITINFLTPRLLDKLYDKLKFYKKHMPEDIDPTLLCELMFTISAVNGEKLNEIEMEDFVKSLNMQDVNTILNYSKKLNSLVGIDNTIILTCDNCTLTYATNLSITSEFFRPTLDI